MSPFSWLAGLAASLLCLSSALAAGAAEGPPLTLGAAVERAVARRPELAGFEFRRRELQARSRAAALRPSPEADFVVEDALGTGTHGGFRSAQATLSLSQVIELGGKRDARLGVTEAEGALLATDRAVQQLDVVAEVARRFVELLRGQSRLAQAREALQIAQRSHESVQQRVAAARAPLAEDARSGAALADAELLLEDAEHELDIARHSLAAAMGEREAAFGSAEGDLLTLPPLAALADLLTRMEQSPDLLRFAEASRVQQAELRLAESLRRADLRASVGLRRLEQADDLALVAGVSLPLFAARRGQPEVDAKRARLERTGSEREAALLRLQAQLYATYLQLEHFRHVTAALQERLLPQLSRAQELTAEAYERGRYSYLEWAAAQRELQQARSRLTETAAQFHLLRIEIERLTASSLDVPGAER